MAMPLAKPNPRHPAATAVGNGGKCTFYRAGSVRPFPSTLKIKIFTIKENNEGSVSIRICTDAAAQKRRGTPAANPLTGSLTGRYNGGGKAGSWPLWSKTTQGGLKCA